MGHVASAKSTCPRFAPGRWALAWAEERLQPTCLGPPQRRRVFASALDAMIDKTVSEAEDYSGYSLRPFPKKEVLYIMVFVPATPDQASVPPGRLSSKTPLSGSVSVPFASR